MTVDITLLVVAYRRPEALHRLLLTAGDAREVVVVNMDADDDVAAATRSARPDAFVVPSPNRGFAAGVNAGIRVVRRPVVVVANDDVTFRPGALRELAGTVRARDGVAAPAIVGPNGSRERTIAANVSLGRLLLEWGLLPDQPLPLVARWCRYGPVAKWQLPTETARVPGVAAAVIACRTELLRSRPLPESYFMYWEEREWFTRLARGGVPVWYVPDAEVTHAGGREVLREDKQRLLVTNSVRCVRQLQSRRAAVVAVLIAVLWQLRTLAQSVMMVAAGRRDRAELHVRVVGLRAALASVRVALGTVR